MTFLFTFSMMNNSKAVLDRTCCPNQNLGRQTKTGCKPADVPCHTMLFCPATESGWYYEKDLPEDSTHRPALMGINQRWGKVSRFGILPLFRFGRTRDSVAATQAWNDVSSKSTLCASLIPTLCMFLCEWRALLYASLQHFIAQIIFCGLEDIIWEISLWMRFFWFSEVIFRECKKCLKRQT